MSIDHPVRYLSLISEFASLNNSKWQQHINIINSLKVSSLFRVGFSKGLTWIMQAREAKELKTKRTIWKKWSFTNTIVAARKNLLKRNTALYNQASLVSFLYNEKIASTRGYFLARSIVAFFTLFLVRQALLTSLAINFIRPMYATTQRQATMQEQNYPVDSSLSYYIELE
ncbi:hypothetical protein FGO68_gene64 [Halteria grandinella]|uniref:Uncharacterized protein n=1 Tax=Halteria grandinella TaxID=5974 RepID=A0A8J8NG40_HALGN|nr:hypothetical protein FGO68_gene64 [Halteria grandinella]